MAELFNMHLKDYGEMVKYLSVIKAKISELAAVGTKIDDDIKLGIIFNGLPEGYRYLVVALEQQEQIDFDELFARLVEEARLYGHRDIDLSVQTALKASTGTGKLTCYFCGEVGHVKKDCKVRKFREKKYLEGKQVNAV